MVTLQFGSGNPNETDVVVSHSLAMDIFGKSYVTDTTFDPTKLTNKILVWFHNTTLEIFTELQTQQTQLGD